MTLGVRLMLGVWMEVDAAAGLGSAVFFL